MRIPLGWLREYVDLDLDPDALAARLTLLGFEVQGIERWGADWRGVVVGELLTVEPHPRADRLSLTRVTVGTGEPLEIVCGATNIAPGQRVPVALPGAVLPGDRRIDRTEKMGVVSNGMLCSGDELHLTGDADGILILPPDTPLSQELETLYGDVVLDVDVKPNRGDALSLVGLAREISAMTGAPVRFPPTDVEEAGDAVERRLSVAIEDPALCTRFVGRWVGGVRIAPSPDAVQMRLLAAGMRPVSNVVDASNYVMLELGKPIHTFDAAAVHGGRIVVRAARPGERLETLDHVHRDLTPDTLLIADPEGPLAIAGVMGGATSEIGDTTRDVIIESAIFDPVSIRRTAFRFALRSEASLRFEKGQEPRLARLGADRTARLLQQWAGGTVARGRIELGAPEPERDRVPFRPAAIERLLGTTIPATRQRELLARVGIEVEAASGAARVPVALDPTPLHVISDPSETLVAVVPTWRSDLRIEADVAEEVARIHGYEQIPAALPDTVMPPYRPHPLEARDHLRRVLAGAGLTEVVTHALVTPSMAEMFGPLDDGPVPAGEMSAGGALVTVTNPLSRDHSVMRRSLVGSLLEIVGVNLRHGQDGIAVFEIGKGYGWDGTDGREWWRLGFALTGPARPPHWADAPRPFDLDDGKGLVELIAAELRLGTVRYEPLSDADGFHPGRTARALVVDGTGRPALVGRLGEVHPARLAALDLRADRVLVAELSITGLASGRPSAVRATMPPRTPAVERDLAVVIADAVPAAAVEEVVRAHAGERLRSLRLFDQYRGAPLDTGEKSLAYRLVFQDAERTLTDDEIDAAIVAITAGLGTIGGRIRT